MKLAPGAGCHCWLVQQWLAHADRAVEALPAKLAVAPVPAKLAVAPGAYVESKVGREARFIPVILPGVEGTPELPIFVGQSLWVDMRDWKEPDSDAFPRLVCGILGIPPGDSPKGLSARHVWEFQKGRPK